MSTPREDLLEIGWAYATTVIAGRMNPTSLFLQPPDELIERIAGLSRRERGRVLRGGLRAEPRRPAQW